MRDIVEVAAKLKQRAERCGVYFSEPCKPEILENLLRDGQDILQNELPEDYVKFLEISDGLGTQRGILYGAADFVEQNRRVWLCETSLEATADGTVVHFKPKEHRKIPSYAWLGCNGNMDGYIFDFNSRQFAVTILGNETEIWNSYSNFADLLHYMTEENDV